MIARLKQLIREAILHRRDRNMAKIQHNECCSIIKSMDNSVNLPREYEKSIQNYYSKLISKKIDSTWHKLYYNANGLENERFIPIDILFTRIIPFFNDINFSEAYSDKSQYERLFPDISHPKTYIKRVNGSFYVADKIVSLKKAVESFPRNKSVIIKPTIYTSQGEGVKLFNADGFSNENIEDIFDYYGNNFIVQELVKSHNIISQLNQSSLNTLRIITFRKDTDVYVLSVTLKIGKSGENVDNGHHGGFFCGVDKTGRLKKYVYTLNPFTKSEYTENGIAIHNLKLPVFNKVLDCVRECAKRLPYSRYAGWDIAIDQNCNPILIEVNLKCPGGNIMQIPNGPLFGDETDAMLKEVFK